MSIVLLMLQWVPERLQAGNAQKFMFLKQRQQIPTSPKQLEQKYTEIGFKQLRIFLFDLGLKTEGNRPDQNRMKTNSVRDVDHYLVTLKECRMLTEAQLRKLCDMAKQVLIQQPNLKRVKAPVNICGDIHGQFEDLMELFRIGGDVPFANYLFLGDYVDRGHHSVETISLLLCLKVRYPERITILRGNHQSRTVTITYGFYDECMRKYASGRVWNMLMEVFDYLPVAAVVEQQLFCMHGGLSPSVSALNQINSYDRKAQIPQQGAICDLVWSDPDERMGWGMNQRGVAFTFGQDISQQFTHTNNLKQIVRAHQLMPKGYLKAHNDKVLTIFSAPNYCYRCGNLAAFLSVDEKLQTSLQQFDPSPYVGDNVEKRRVPDYFM